MALISLKMATNDVIYQLIDKKMELAYYATPGKTFVIIIAHLCKYKTIASCSGRCLLQPQPSCCSLPVK